MKTRKVTVPISIESLDGKTSVSPETQIGILLAQLRGMGGGYLIRYRNVDPATRDKLPFKTAILCSGETFFRSGEHKP